MPSGIQQLLINVTCFAMGIAWDKFQALEGHAHGELGANVYVLGCLVSVEWRVLLLQLPRYFLGNC